MKSKNNKQPVSIKVPVAKNKLLEKVVEEINSNKEIHTLWKVINVNALDRIKMTDHGTVHFQIVANIALRFSRILGKNNIKMSIVEDFNLSNDHAEVVLFLASILHDLGMSVSREGHEEFSLFLVNSILRESLNFLPIEERTIIISEVLHAIISHRKNGKPLTLEAGIVRVADALDMSEGRSKAGYEAGIIDIHSLSHAAIDEIEISEGKEKPILITITMNNSAGIFQVDELLKSKLKGSGIEKYVQVRAYVKEENEKRLIDELII